MLSLKLSGVAAALLMSAIGVQAQVQYWIDPASVPLSTRSQSPTPLTPDISVLHTDRPRRMVQ